MDVRGRARRGPGGLHRATGSTRRDWTRFYEESAGRCASRTTITGQTQPTVAGRKGYRLDTETGERTQTVVIWPSARADFVNVVITDDLPDARIQDAIDAFGGPLMFRFLVRHGLVRVVGGRLVPALMVWDLAVLANKTRQIPIVDRGLRRGASAARPESVVGSDVRPESRREAAVGARPTSEARTVEAAGRSPHDLTGCITPVLESPP